MGNSVSCCIPVQSNSSSSLNEKPPGKRNNHQLYENGKKGGLFNNRSREEGFSMSVSSTDSWGQHSATGNGGDLPDAGGKVLLRKDLLRLKGEQKESMTVISTNAATHRMHSESSSNIQHISEREPEDGINDPSINPKQGPIFMVRSKSELRENREKKRRSQYLVSGEKDIRENGKTAVFTFCCHCSTAFLRCQLGKKGFVPPISKHGV